MLLLLLIFLSQRPGHFFRLPDLFSCIHCSLGVKRNYCAKVELGISDNKQGCIRNTGETEHVLNSSFYFFDPTQFSFL